MRMSVLNLLPALSRLSMHAGIRNISACTNPLYFKVSSVLLKQSRQLKPISEIEVPSKLIEEREQRLRKLPSISEEEAESRILLQKDWNKYKTQQHLAIIQTIDSILHSQQRALDELRAESEELYQQAIQIDFDFIPYTTKGPLKTPPIENYDCPDGEYTNITRKFDGEE
ncbi:39S ribosomal protein L40, mitochondrial [Pogonomyrmex barbatus]|uniref:Large ribosomal subunit protein mL40 n=1 Tax=Pogonomyrmex barbatus TaxID=144034 RepID=A0A6I9W709_9HYME|nr:39S ribosomal protein L40, mitochondrial [Pogonomyrmex barbatus]